MNEGDEPKPEAAERAPEASALVPADDGQRAVAASPGASGMRSLATYASMSPHEKAKAIVERWLQRHKKTTRDVYKQVLDTFARFMGVGPPARQFPRRRKDPVYEEAQALARVMAVELLLADEGRANLLMYDWTEAMRAEGLSPNTIRMRSFALKSLVALAKRGRAIAWELDISPPKATIYRDTRGPSDESTMRILDHYEKRLASDYALSPTTKTTLLRDHAMISLMLGAGLRRFEVAALNAGDVDLANRTVTILGKHRDAKEKFPIEDWTISAIEQWMQHFLGNDPDPKDPLFITLDPVRSGNQIQPGGVSFVVAELAKELNLGDVRCHGFRHRFITEMTERVTDPASIMKAARHTDFKTTLMYIDNAKDRARRGVAAAGESLREKLEKWRGHK